MLTHGFWLICQKPKANPKALLLYTTLHFMFWTTQIIKRGLHPSLNMIRAVSRTLCETGIRGIRTCMYRNQIQNKRRLQIMPSFQEFCTTFG